MKYSPSWLQQDRLRQYWRDDLVAGIVVGILVIPQSLGYALLAGLPPVYGLYAAILPTLAYAWIGASNTQAVGPVAITSVMTAQALFLILPAHTALADYALFAALMAALVGIMLLLAGLLRLGWLTQFMSRGVVAGFISGAALLIAIGQLKHLLGIKLQGDTLIKMLQSGWQHLGETNLPTLWIGLSALLTLLAARRWLSSSLVRWGVPPRFASLLSRMTPVVVVMLTTALSAMLGLEQDGVRIIGSLPAGLPAFLLPALPDIQTLQQMLPAAGLIALIAFISSASVAQSFARKRKERFDANDELIGLGWANLAGSINQGFPVTGGFSRTAVNVEAGAQTPLAGVISALVMALVLWLFTDWFYALPLAVLGASIMAAIANLIDLDTVKQAWRFDRADAWAYLVTALGVMLLGLQMGLLAGLLLSFATLLWRSSQPHLAVVGQVGDSAHFRNVQRHTVRTWPTLLLLRIDESLYFGNTQSVLDRIESELNAQPRVRDLVLMMSAVNHIDLSAQQMLEELNGSLLARGIRLHLAELKGPVMDLLQGTPLLRTLSGQRYITTLDAVQQLAPAPPPPEYHL